MLETAEERVKLLKTGVSEKEIERLYIEHNNFKIIRTPILYEANEFAAPPSFKKNKKTKSKLLLSLAVIILVLFVPILTLLLAFVLMLLFVPPIFAFTIILLEGKSVISKEFMRLPVKKNILVSI